MAVHKHQFIVDNSGKKTAVILDIEEYEELTDEVEELEDLVGRNAESGSAERFAIRRIALTGTRPTD